MTRPSIYEAAGGSAAFLALAAAHHERCLADPELNHAFSRDINPEHVEHLAAYWAEVLGGPHAYSSGMGHRAMVALHAGTGAGPDWSARFVACFVAAMDDAHLPDDPELRRALRAYIEWATDDVMSYAPVGAVVPAELPIPHWSWDGLVR